jgi:NADH-quinone oxidoreductase subunit G
MADAPTHRLGGSWPRPERLNSIAHDYIGMTTIFIENKPFTVSHGRNLLDVCLSEGFDLPYFCWHPAMGSVGACRQCAVVQFRNEQDTGGRLVMACMTPAAEGTRISIDHPDAKSFRQGVIEWLMLNHPHDCPVCDEGGECHLQDMTYLTGHNYRRYDFDKRTYRNQDLGPFIKHDMNRCIQCYRCVRFYRDYAGGRDLNVFGVHDHVYFGRSEDGVLQNEFSGNLVEVCPTGVFVDKTLFHHYTRKWDLQSAQSICPHCSLGCNTTPGERYGILRRVSNRFNSQVNGYFLCDRGRFGYGYVNDDARIRRPIVRAGADRTAHADDPPQALAYCAALRKRARGIIGIGSPRASLEANMALRSLVGPGQFYLGLARDERRLLDAILKMLREGPVPSASIKDAEEADAVLVLGEDLLNSAPRLALALVQAGRQQPMEAADELKIPRWDDAAVRNVVQEARGPIFLAHHRRTWLHDHSKENLFAAPADIARLGFAVAHAVDHDAPAVPEASQELLSFASRISDALLASKRPLIISGIGLGSEETIQAAAQVAWALARQGKRPHLNFVVPESNSMGAAMMEGGTFEEALHAVDRRQADTVIVLENDLYRRAPQREVETFFSNIRALVSVDSFHNGTTARADVVFPAGTAHESDGTFVNNEGRAQRFYQVFMPEGDVGTSWRWLREIARSRAEWSDGALAAASQEDGPGAWRNIDDAIAATAAAIPTLSGIVKAGPSASLRVLGQKIPRQPERYSGRTAMQAHLTVHEPTPSSDPDSPLAFSMEGYRGDALPSPVIPQFWAPRWNSNQAVNKFQQEVGGPLREELPGVRLIEPLMSSATFWFTRIPSAFQPMEGRWLILPMAEVFGSEELSRQTSVIGERTPAPYIVLHPEDARRLRVKSGALLSLAVQGRLQEVTLRTSEETPGGTVGLSLLGDRPPVATGEWIDLRQAIQPESRAA